MLKSAILIAILSLFQGCSTPQELKDSFACSELDWFEIGRSDGVRGLDSMSYENKKKGCEGFSTGDHEKYVNGWYSGVDRFCSMDQGFAYGRTGNKYLNVCPSSKEKEFLKAYRKGLKVYLYERDNQEITEELQRISDQASKTAGEQAPVLVKKMNELETRLELNKALISEIQNEMETQTL
jgi:hypothetical protein